MMKQLVELVNMYQSIWACFSIQEEVYSLANLATISPNLPQILPHITPIRQSLIVLADLAELHKAD